MPEIRNTDNTMQMSQAILLYTGGYQGSMYASIHDVEIEKTGPRIGVGRAITVEAIELTMQALARAAGTETIQWSDDRMVATTPTLICWWTPACERWMHFNASNLKASRPAKQPPLLWVATGGKLYVFALEKNERPTQDTVLLQSPYFNVYSGGNVCQGSMVLPNAPTRKDWEDAFFASTFTHANPPNRKVTANKGTDAALWKKQMGAKLPDFPVALLLSTNRTLGELIKQLAKE